MLSDLRISLIQTQLHWENKAQNLAHFTDLISGQAEANDLIVLPEMFSTGFTMNARAMAENLSGKTLDWMKEMARSHQTCITGSFIAEESGKYYNRLVWMRPDGQYTIYDKRHLFRMAEEDHHYAGGHEQLIVELKGWKIRPLICYDLRFPVWSRNRYQGTAENLKASYDLLLYVANWPAARVTAWDALLRARAVENQAYCLGVNRVGPDGKGIEYNGHSAVIDAKGEYLLGPVENEEGVYTVNLNFTELSEFRAKFPQGLDADEFQINL